MPTVWGRALNQLRAKKGITQGELARRHIIGKDEYYRLCHSKRGPTISTLDALLQGMGCTWQDWAIAYEDARQSKRTEQLNKIGMSNGVKHPA